MLNDSELTSDICQFEACRMIGRQLSLSGAKVGSGLNIDLHLMSRSLMTPHREIASDGSSKLADCVQWQAYTL